MKLKSKRNYVEKLDIDGRSCVRKHFYSMDAWRAELQNHALIAEIVPAADIISAVPGLIVSDYLPFPHLLDVLEMQEKQDFVPSVWENFAAWLKELAGKSSILPAEGNLRNFLWDDGRETVIPVDLEHWREIPFRECAEGIVAFLMEYEPAESCVKRSAAELLIKCWELEEDRVEKQRLELRKRRLERAVHRREFSFILLAGGLSRRMGSGKAELNILGKLLLEHQLETAVMLGADDILISGNPEYTGCADSVVDELPHRGPLGGIYSCMKRAKHEKCVVLGVDMPAVTAEMLGKLVREHHQGGGITLAAHGGMPEPLAGVYDTALCEKIRELIAEEGVSMRRLIQECSVKCVDLYENEPLWYNCNTPKEYESFVCGELTQSMLKNI